MHNVYNDFFVILEMHGLDEKLNPHLDPGSLSYPGDFHHLKDTSFKANGENKNNFPADSLQGGSENQFRHGSGGYNENDRHHHGNNRFRNNNHRGNNHFERSNGNRRGSDHFRNDDSHRGNNNHHNDDNHRGNSNYHNNEHHRGNNNHHINRNDENYRGNSGFDKSNRNDGNRDNKSKEQLNVPVIDIESVEQSNIEFTIETDPIQNKSFSDDDSDISTDIVPPHSDADYQSGF